MSVYRCDDCGTSVSVEDDVKKVFCSNCGRMLYDASKSKPLCTETVQFADDCGIEENENKILSADTIQDDNYVLLVEESEQDVLVSRESKPVPESLGVCDTSNNEPQEVLSIVFAEDTIDTVENEEVADVIVTDACYASENVLPAVNGIPITQEVPEYNQVTSDNIVEKKSLKKEWIIAAIIAVVVLLIAGIVAICFLKSQQMQDDTPVDVYESTTDSTMETSFGDGAFYVYLERNDGQERLKTYMTEPGLVPEPNEPTLYGYVFDGWYSDLEFTNSWDFNTDIASGEMTIYAKWIEEISQVEIEGVGDNSDNAVDNSLSNKEILFLKDIVGLTLEEATQLYDSPYYCTEMYSTSYEKGTIINKAGEGWSKGPDGVYAYRDDSFQVFVSAGPAKDAEFYDYDSYTEGVGSEDYLILDTHFLVKEGVVDPKTNEIKYGKQKGPFTWEELQTKYGYVVEDYTEEELSNVNLTAKDENDFAVNIEPIRICRYNYEVYD